MRFSLALVASALVAFVSAQAAGGPNAFNVPVTNGKLGYSLVAGKPTTFTWSNLQGSSVTINLRQGPSGSLGPPTLLKANLPNKGTFTYTPPTSILAGSDYSLEIVDDQDPTAVNHTPQFPIASSGTGASTITTTDSSTSAASSTASTTTTDSSTATTTTDSTTLTTSTTSASSTDSASTTDTSASSSATGSQKSSATKTSAGSTTTAASSAASTASPTTAPGGNDAQGLRVGGAVVAVAVAMLAAF